MVSFDGLTPPDEILQAVERGTTVSFCLFAHRNVESPGQVRELTEALYQAARRGGQLPPLIGIDQEGGQLVAIGNGATELPGNMALGATRSPELAEQAGRVLGRELLAMGINLNFAPSMDVNINAANPVIGIRSFGDDPALVRALGTAMIAGLQAEGVIATAKHFPGHGDIENDTHFGSVAIHHSLERVNTVELAPFRAAIQADVGAVMTGHIIFSALDKQNPATLSPVILDGLLRETLGFKKLIITDAMDMQAVAQRGRTESVLGALEAGADLILLGHIPDQLALARELAGRERASAVERIRQARQGLRTERPPLDVVGCREHWELAQAIANRSITLVKNHGRLPLRLDGDARILVITAKPADLTPADTSSGVTIALAEAIRRRHERTDAIEVARYAGDNDINAALDKASAADVVIVGTINADQDESQARLVRELQTRGKQPIVIAMRTPYDLIAFESVETYLCSYGIRSVSMEAVARVLFGEIEATGTLPCAIRGATSQYPA